MPTATLPDEILEPGDGRIRALVVHGGNPVAVFPDQDKTVRALKALDLLVVVDPFMTATARFAHYVVAPKHFLERADATTLLDASLPVPFGQFTDAMVPAPGDLIEEWDLGWELARRMGLTLKIPGIGMQHKPASDEVMAALSGHGRVSLAEVRKYPSGHVFGELVVGAVLPHAITHADKKMAAGHPAALAELRAVRTEAFGDGGAEAHTRFRYRLVSMRMPEVFNSKGQNLPSLRARHRYNPAYMHPSDLEAIGMTDGNVVVIDSGRGRIRAVAQASPDIERGVVAMAHGWGLAAEHEGDIRATGSPTARLIADDEGADSVTGMPLMTAIPVNVLPA
jgi:anaerobic selenocysteine-containing dehydrogenase